MEKQTEAKAPSIQASQVVEATSLLCLCLVVLSSWSAYADEQLGHLPAPASLGTGGSGDSETSTTGPASGREKKDDATSGGEKKDDATSGGEKKDDATSGEEKKDDATSGGEKKDDATSDVVIVNVTIENGVVGFDRELVGDLKSQKLQVDNEHRHVWFWVPRWVRKKKEELCKPGDALDPQNSEASGASSEQSLAPRAVELIGPDLGQKKTMVTLPPLQYGIHYCFGFGNVEDNPGTALITQQRVRWPMNDNVSWWSERYVTAAVGLGLTRGKSMKDPPYGYDSNAAPFVYVGAHITPWPTDRHIPNQDRVGSYGEHVHILLAAAMTDPWPNAKTATQLGTARGLVIGAGYSLGDNIVGLTLGLVIGQGGVEQVDALGVTTSRTVTLISPLFGLSTQADIVSLLGKAGGR